MSILLYRNNNKKFNNYFSSIILNRGISSITLFEIHKSIEKKTQIRVTN